MLHVFVTDIFMLCIFFGHSVLLTKLLFPIACNVHVSV